MVQCGYVTFGGTWSIRDSVLGADLVNEETQGQGQPNQFAILAECDISEEALAHFGSIVRELASLLSADPLRSLRAVVVVDHSQIASKANELIRRMDARRSYFPDGVLGPEGLALPLEQHGSLESFVLIAREVAESLSRPVQFRSPNAISTILEELLHVCVYGLAKRRRGYLHPDQTSTLPCDVDLHVIGSQMCDEYVVNRLKTRILGQLPLIQEKPDGPLIVGQLCYGADPRTLVSLGFERLSNILVEGRSGSRPASEAWAEVARILYRNFFEPLARYSAYVDDLGPSGLDEELSAIDGYQHFLRPHWLTTHEGLRRLIASDLVETEHVLEAILSTLRAILMDLGVTYGGTPGDCWIKFGDIQPLWNKTGNECR